MSQLHPRATAPAGAGHPAVLDRQVRDVLKAVGFALVSLALGLAIAIAVPRPNVVAAVAVIAGAVAVVLLIASSRLEVTVTVLAIYCGILDGPVKLLSGGGTATSAVRNVLIFGVAIGAILRLVVKRERITLPPLSGWILGLIAIVLVEAFNPQTGGVLHFIGGFRQQLQWVPFFFFGYVLVRSTSRFRKMFIILGVLALANGIVSTYQTRLSPGQLASWGPGYHQRIYGQVIEGKKKGGGRVYVSEGEGRVRPPALGSDSGFGGGVGVIALPGTLALLALWRIRRRWIGVVLAFGAILAVATCLGRVQVVGAALGVMAFAALSASLGRRMTKPVATLLGVGLLALPLGAIFVAYEGNGTFKRYETIAPEKVVGTGSKSKSGALSLLPHQISVAPFGVGLGSVGAVGGFGGKSTDLLEGHSVSAETQFNFMADELGLPGLILWVLFTVDVIFLAVRRLRRIPDVEVRLALAAVTAPLISFFAMGFSGPTTVGAAAGPYIFFASGIIAYWFAGPGWRLARSRASGRDATRSDVLTPTLAPGPA
jgi:hypothetical protein